MQIINNFKQLEEENELEFKQNTTRVKKSIDNSLATFSFLGGIIDLYLTKMVDVFLKITDNSGNKKEDENSNVENS